MTPNQKILARHALGLSNGYANGRSYRNRYICGYGSPYTSWMRMVRDGLATKERFGAHRDDRFIFYLTFEGAKAALEPGERLDPEDFPQGA